MRIQQKTPRLVAWPWLVVFCVSLFVFISTSAVILKEPTIYARVKDIRFSVGGVGKSSQNEFKTSDIIPVEIVYYDALPETKVDLVFARLVSDPQYRNGREILAQVSVPLYNTNGKRTYQFPAYERKAGNYEITLQNEGQVFLSQKIQLKNE